jgi:hypothetical protein
VEEVMLERKYSVEDYLEACRQPGAATNECLQDSLIDALQARVEQGVTAISAGMPVPTTLWVEIRNALAIGIIMGEKKAREEKCQTD